MFIKTSNPTFLDFWDISSDDIDFTSKNNIPLNSKSINELKLVCDDYTFIKVTKGKLSTTIDGNAFFLKQGDLIFKVFHLQRAYHSNN